MTGFRMTTKLRDFALPGRRVPMNVGWYDPIPMRPPSGIDMRSFKTKRENDDNG